jgi:hypothetical protein
MSTYDPTDAKIEEMRRMRRQAAALAGRGLYLLPGYDARDTADRAAASRAASSLLTGIARAIARPSTLTRAIARPSIPTPRAAPRQMPAIPESFLRGIRARLEGTSGGRSFMAIMG